MIDLSGLIISVNVTGGGAWAGHVHRPPPMPSPGEAYVMQDYERAANNPDAAPGARGTSRRFVMVPGVMEGYHDLFIQKAEEFFDEWERVDSTGPFIVTFKEKFFVPFGAGEAGFERSKWDAGTFDLDAATAQAAILSSRVKEPSELLVEYINTAPPSVEGTYLKSANWNWTSTFGGMSWPETTSEDRLKTVDEAFAISFFKETEPTGEQPYYGAMFDEMTARAAAMDALFADIFADGIPARTASMQEHFRQNAVIWPAGSQTKNRGE